MIASLFVDSFRYVPDNASLLFHKGVGMLELVFVALGIACAIALPLGLWLGHKHRGLFLALAVSNVARALPSIVLIGFAILLFRFSLFGDCVAALVVIALPPVLVNSFVAIESVDADVVEAARGMGLTEWQILRRIELPLGLPLILAGLRLGSVFAIATATIAGIVGGGGLGDIVVNPTTYGQAGVLGASYCVAALALLVAGALALIQRAAFRRMHPTA